MLSEDSLNTIIEIIRDYNAKSKCENISIYKHVMDLEKVRREILDVFDIEKELGENLRIAIIFHDIGKIIDYFQENLETTNRTIRHEILSASISGIADNIRLAILTSHKSLEKLQSNIKRKEYEDELREMELKLSVKFENIKNFIDYCMVGEGENLVTNLENILLKGYLNYCDHLASGKMFKLDKGLKTLRDFKIPGAINTIQKKVLNLKRPTDVIIIGTTGFGKTAAAMFWSNLVQNLEKSKRIYYILPYTSSINAKFLEMEKMNLSVGMLHGKAEYFLDNYKCRDNYKQFKKSIKQITITTIFQLIKAMFSCKRFEMLICQMKSSIFIVDEIHSFDIKELSYILEMLKWLKENLGVRICIMSASIPTSLMEIIKERLCIEEIILQDKNDFKERHKVERRRKGILDDLANIEKEIKKEKKVLICVNSASLAQSLYKYFKNKFPKLKENEKLKIVHGRFSDRDRIKAEEGVYDSKVLIGTQVIEVSLNIDFDILFTELAPLDALIQRFGRVNRFGLKNIGMIYIYDGKNSIYNKEILEKTELALNEIINEDKGIIKEYKIQYYLDKVYQEFDYKQYDKYKKIIKEILMDLRVGSYSDIARKIIEKDTLRVIPKGLYKEYLKLVEEKRYLEAESLKVSIKNLKVKTKDIFEYDKKNKVYVVKYKYTEELGLEFEKIE